MEFFGLGSILGIRNGRNLPTKLKNQATLDLWVCLYVNPRLFITRVCTYMYIHVVFDWHSVQTFGTKKTLSGNVFGRNRVFIKSVPALAVHDQLRQLHQGRDAGPVVVVPVRRVHRVPVGADDDLPVGIIKECKTRLDLGIGSGVVVISLGILGKIFCFPTINLLLETRSRSDHARRPLSRLVSLLQIFTNFFVNFDQFVALGGGLCEAILTIFQHKNIGSIIWESVSCKKFPNVSFLAYNRKNFVIWAIFQRSWLKYCLL
jgi:hypothetical protein